MSLIMEDPKKDLFAMAVNSCKSSQNKRRSYWLFDWNVDSKIKGIGKWKKKL